MPAAPRPDKCVGCRRQPIDPRWRPFCSERCKLLDLAQWADGAYRVAGEPVADTDPDAETTPDGSGPQDG